MDEQVEELLRRSTPEPDPGFVHSLENRLLPPREPQRRHRPLLAGAALAAALACAALGLSLAGVGPLAGGDGVQADSNCRFVTVTRVEQVPRVVDGKLELRDQPVQRRVKRCS
jgi:ferric-dicitrate binding protein FerR (iron transport regulator)